MARRREHLVRRALGAWSLPMPDGRVVVGADLSWRVVKRGTELVMEETDAVVTKPPRGD